MTVARCYKVEYQWNTWNSLCASASVSTDFMVLYKCCYYYYH